VRLGIACLVSALFVGIASTAGAAAPDADRGVLTLTFENDSLAGLDRYYTSGQRIGWQSRNGAPGPLASAAAWLAPWLLPAEARPEWGVALGQAVYTPDARRTDSPPRDDRPYAGALTASFGLHAADDARAGVLELALGVVGPAALAEQAQDFAHSLTGRPDAGGWDLQISNRPVAMLTLERRWRREARLGERLAVDVVPALGANLGNLQTSAAVGALLRVGRGLGMDFGPPRMRPALSGLGVFRPPEGFAGYLFLGLEGRAVAWDATLDGNRNGYWRIDREPFLAEVPFGLALAWRGARLHATGVLQSRSFDEQSSTPHAFGSVSLSFAF
jgi:lipid A 3-O-deacylase